MRMRSLIVLLLTLTACTNGSLSDKTASPFSENLPGAGSMVLPATSDLWSPSKAEKADDDWWSHYYGGK